jgi:sulfur-oxidizing protein SoxZ
MSDPMRMRAKLVDGKVEVRVLMSHQMETGQRKDPAGKTIPAWYIQNVTATCNGKTVLSAQWGPAVSQNPLMIFKFGGAQAGQEVEVTWVDNKGGKRTDKAKIES